MEITQAMARAMTYEGPVSHSVAVQLPTFNRTAPTAWFSLEDANFHLRGITQSDAKYWYVVSKLDPDRLMKLSVFLTRKRGADPYSEIRALLCRTYEPKMERKLDALLAVNDIWDERPSEYALELRRLLGEATLDNILKCLFVRSLPKHIANAISGSGGYIFRRPRRGCRQSLVSGVDIQRISQRLRLVGRKSWPSSSPAGFEAHRTGLQACGTLSLPY